MFGFGPAFATALAGIGPITVDEFARRHPSGAEYLPQLTWDPTTAKSWDLFRTNRLYQLDDRELEVFQRQGFVVSERLGRVGLEQPWDGATMGNAFLQLWGQDLPVFISTDAILHAWHRTYDLMLEEIEESLLRERLDGLLRAMSDQLPSAQAEAGAGVLRESVLDADLLVGVARALLVPGLGVGSRLGQGARVSEILGRISERKLVTLPDFMGHCRVVDFSQFEVRGHYTHSFALGTYFLCLTWLGRIDLPVAGGPFERCPGGQRMASPCELGTAIILHRLIEDSGRRQDWEDLERVMRAFVGRSDSLTSPQLGGILAGAGIRSLADLHNLADLERIQSALLHGDLGTQNIRSDAFFAPLEEGIPTRLPRSFLVFGQRFVPDSWVFSQTVFDSLQWPEEGRVTFVQRRVPSALDIAFAVFGNDQVVPNLVERMNQTNAGPSASHAQRFRDGLPYQHNLAAARAVIDGQRPEAWNDGLAMSWLAALRTLSSPTTGAEFPEVMRTRTWAMRTLNTQLASWTQYRHDTILYAKQSYTGILACYYPEGFVEPRTEFWERLTSLAADAADLVESLPFPDAPARTTGVPLPLYQSNQVAHLWHFAETARTLGRMAAKELAQQPFSTEEELFVRNLMQNVGWDPLGSGRTPRYSGWYPKLFYQPIRHTALVPPATFEEAMYADRAAYFHEKYGVSAGDLIVADVHTDLPDLNVGDPGSVLHEGIGNVSMLYVAVNNGPDRMVFAGPVLTHQEFESVGEPFRLTDSLWHDLHLQGLSPAGHQIEGASPPAWVTNYFVPAR